MDVEISDSMDPLDVGEALGNYYVPFLKEISVDDFIKLVFLCRNFKANEEIRVVPAGEYGIKLSSPDGSQYFSFGQEMDELASFYNELSKNKSKKNLIKISIQKVGTLDIEGRKVVFKIADNEKTLLEALVSSPEGTDLGPLAGEKLSSILKPSLHGYVCPCFKPINDTSNSAFNVYCERGNILANLSSEEPFKNATKTLVEIARGNAKKERFTAICAPSLSGKTQLAFSLNTNALLFPLLESFGDINRIQEIYRCYEEHVRVLLECVKLDMHICMKRRKKTSVYNSTILSMGEIKDCFLTSASFTVGYFFLIAESLKEITDPREYHRSFCRIGSFKKNFVSSMTLQDLDRKSMSDYFPVVFLDEFPSKDINLANKNEHVFAAATLRNFLRAMKFVCIVMGTEPTLVNMVATSRVRISREATGLWCTVITQFPCIPEVFLKIKCVGCPGDSAGRIHGSELSSPIDLIDKLGQKVKQLSLLPFGNYPACSEYQSIALQSLFLRQFLTSRPGLAWIIMSSVKEALRKENSIADVLSLFGKICAILSNRIRGYKPGITSWGTLCSFLGNRSIGYLNSELDESVTDYHSFVDRHFYFIRQPKCFKCFSYMSCINFYCSSSGNSAGSGDENRNAHVCVDEEQNIKFPLKMGRYGGDEFLPDGVFTVFLPPPLKELFIYLCIWNDWTEPVSTYIYNSTKSIGYAYRRYILHRLIARKNDGQIAEEIWTSVMINASHRAPLLILHGDFFLTSIIANAENRLVEGVRKIVELKEMQQQCAKVPLFLQNQLTELHVPYLCPSGSYFPKQLYEVFPYMFGKCQRTQNKTMIDFVFELSLIDKEKRYPALGIGEMKDWEQPLGPGDIHQILRLIPLSENILNSKGYFWGRCKLHLIFCRQITSTLKKDYSEPREYDENEECLKYEITPSGAFSRKGNPLNLTKRGFNLLQKRRLRREMAAGDLSDSKRIDKVFELHSYENRSCNENTELYQLIDDLEGSKEFNAKIEEKMNDDKCSKELWKRLSDFCNCETRRKELLSREDISVAERVELLKLSLEQNLTIEKLLKSNSEDVVEAKRLKALIEEQTAGLSGNDGTIKLKSILGSSDKEFARKLLLSIGEQPADSTGEQEVAAKIDSIIEISDEDFAKRFQNLIEEQMENFPSKLEVLKKLEYMIEIHEKKTIAQDLIKSVEQVANMSEENLNELEQKFNSLLGIWNHDDYIPENFVSDFDSVVTGDNLNKTSDKGVQGSSPPTKGQEDDEKSLRTLIGHVKEQKINLYYFDKNSQEIKKIYEDYSHDLISIILPIQNGYGHLALINGVQLPEIKRDQKTVVEKKESLKTTAKRQKTKKDTQKVISPFTIQSTRSRSKRFRIGAPKMQIVSECKSGEKMETSSVDGSDFANMKN